MHGTSQVRFPNNATKTFLAAKAFLVAKTFLAAKTFLVGFASVSKTRCKQICPAFSRQQPISS
jgi:hypothetical protein